MEGVSEQGSRRYPRTFGGLIASMVVLVVIVVPVVLIGHWWGDARRDEGNKEIGLGKTVNGVVPADWASTVRTVQKAEGEQGVDIHVVYPRSLPSGWYANTDPGFDPGKHPTWTMNFTDGKSGYVGIQQGPGRARDLAKKELGGTPSSGAAVTLDGGLGGRWTPWTGTDGDHGYSRSFQGSTLIVWGPRDADVRQFLALLTTRPLR